MEKFAVQRVKLKKNYILRSIGETLHQKNKNKILLRREISKNKIENRISIMKNGKLNGKIGR